MDNFHPQTGGHVKEGHEESDLSIRGIVLFGVSLAVAGAATFVGVLLFYWGLQKYEKAHEPAMTPVQNQLYVEREAAKPAEKPAAEEVRTGPDWYGRGEMEKHLAKTFPGPRLQYDDTADMDLFRGSEDEWLRSTGKDSAGNIHIPVDRAMELLVQRGLPQVSGPFLPTNLPSAVPLVPAPAAQKK